jgi:rSAM/selenodomain-associated transferase 2
MARLSIIIPVLDEGEAIAAALDALADLRRLGTEVIVVDGGSRDDTVRRAQSGADLVIDGPRGRALQMNTGANAAAGDVLLFLHADTRLPPAADRLVLEGLEQSGRAWGRFDVKIPSSHPLLILGARLMNRRSRMTGIATGDQAIFVQREVFAAIGGFPPIALMEDVALSKRLKRVSPPLCIRDRVVTSARRWEANGVLRTILLMWWLRLAFFFGSDPATLAKRYGYDSGSH